MRDRYGVNAHIIHGDGIGILSSAGIRWFRVDVEWRQVEAEQGRENWDEVDRVVANAEVVNGSVLAVLAYAPPWATGTDKQGGVPRDPSLFLQFVHRAAERYGSRIAAWSVWNEPNLKEFWEGDRSTFINSIFRPGLLELRALLPNATLVGPDLSSTRNNRCLQDGWMRECLEAGRDLLNVVSHHQYDGNDTVSGRVSQLDRVHRFCQQFGLEGLPVWCTEIGWKNVTPERQGELLRDMMRAMRFPGRDWWAKTFWYDSHGAGWGMLDTLTLTPRPAYGAYAAVIAEDVPKEEH